MENGPALVGGNCLSFCYFAASKSQTSGSALRSGMALACSLAQLSSRAWMGECACTLESTGWSEQPVFRFVTRTFNRKRISFAWSLHRVRAFKRNSSRSTTLTVQHFFSRPFVSFHRGTHITRTFWAWFNFAAYLTGRGRCAKFDA